MQHSEIIKLDFGSTLSRFDGRSENHYHFVCHKWEKVFDVDMSLESKLNKKVGKASGFNIQDHRLLFCGLCKKCSKQSSCALMKCTWGLVR